MGRRGPAYPPLFEFRGQGKEKKKREEKIERYSTTSLEKHGRLSCFHRKIVTFRFVAPRIDGLVGKKTSIKISLGRVRIPTGFMLTCVSGKPKRDGVSYSGHCSTRVKNTDGSTSLFRLYLPIDDAH